MRYTTSNNYLIEINPLPPFYMDFIEAVYPLKEYPNRIVKNVAGDILELEYKPLQEHSDPEHAYYDLWITWTAVDEHNARMKDLRNKARIDFLLVSCVDVLEGRYTLESTEWSDKLVSIFGDDYHVPHAKRDRLLLFLKYEVIRTLTDKEFILQSAMYPEVNMQGIVDALHTFQNPLGW